MCKNADNPCPGCKKNVGADAKWAFFTKEERQAHEKRQRQTQTVRARTDKS